MRVEKVKLTAFIYKMSCLEYSYSLIKSGYSPIKLTTEEENEIESIINTRLHRSLLSANRRRFKFSKVKLSRKGKSAYQKLKKFEYLIDLQQTLIHSYDQTDKKVAIKWVYLVYVHFPQRLSDFLTTIQVIEIECYLFNRGPVNKIILFTKRLKKCSSMIYAFVSEGYSQH